MEVRISSCGFYSFYDLSLERLKTIFRWYDVKENIDELIFNKIMVYDNYNMTIDVLLVLVDPDIQKTKLKVTIPSGAKELFDNDSYWWHDDE